MREPVQISQERSLMKSHKTTKDPGKLTSSGYGRGTSQQHDQIANKATDDTHFRREYLPSHPPMSRELRKVSPSHPVESSKICSGNMHTLIGQEVPEGHLLLLILLRGSCGDEMASVRNTVEAVWPASHLRGRRYLCRTHDCGWFVESSTAQ